jgi:hypothetical protein
VIECLTNKHEALTSKPEERKGWHCKIPLNHVCLYEVCSEVYCWVKSICALNFDSYKGWGCSSVEKCVQHPRFSYHH